MKYEIKWGEYLKLEIPWKLLHLIYGVMNFLTNFIPKNDEFHHHAKQVEIALKKKIQFEQEAKRFHLCCKCFKEVDTAKDKYKHTIFESGYEIYAHDICPAVNKGEGYEH